MELTRLVRNVLRLNVKSEGRLDYKSLQKNIGGRKIVQLLGMMSERSSLYSDKIAQK